MQIPRNGTPVALHPIGERADEVLLDQRVDGGARGADAGEDDALGGRDLGRACATSRAGSPRCSRAYTTLGALPAR